MIVEKGIEKGLAIPQEQRRSEKLKNDDNILPFKCLLESKGNIWNLQTSKILGKIFGKHKLIDCKKQPSNLKRLLCSSNF